MEQPSAALDRSATDFAQVLADPSPSPSACPRRRERSVALANQLARLKPEYRDVIGCAIFKGAFEEIAQPRQSPSAEEGPDGQADQDAMDASADGL